MLVSSISSAPISPISPYCSISSRQVRAYLRNAGPQTSTEIGASLGVSGNTVRSIMTHDLNRGIIVKVRDSDPIEYRLATTSRLLKAPRVAAAIELLESIGFTVYPGLS